MIDPEDDGCRDAYSGHEGVCASVLAGVDTPPVFDFPEHVFHLLTLQDKRADAKAPALRHVQPTAGSGGDMQIILQTVGST
ncbi:hypothetical protein THS27_22625 [Thalassospira sp. MCCC 1A01428]|nr:hypothetical protein THS27_22625 [Thalassospira sp. MCCC 1A01428]